MSKTHVRYCRYCSIQSYLHDIFKLTALASTQPTFYRLVQLFRQAHCGFIKLPDRRTRRNADRLVVVHNALLPKCELQIQFLWLWRKLMKLKLRLKYGWTKGLKFLLARFRREISAFQLSVLASTANRREIFIEGQQEQQLLSQMCCKYNHVWVNALKDNTF